MIGKVANCAKKSLSLQKDMVFRLLVAMTVLLGWLSGVGTGVVMGLENVYDGWRLEQENQLSIYLLADSPEADIAALEKSLLSLPDVERVTRQKSAETASLIEDYFEDSQVLPTPVVLDVMVKPTLDRAVFDAKVYAKFVDAQVDDARELLTKMSHAVRFGQSVMALFAGIMLVIMVMLVSLTVRAGLRGKKSSLAVLQYVGATDGLISRLIVRQVFWQGLTGWFVSAVLIFAVLHGTKAMRPDFAPYLTQEVYIVALFSPLLLTVIATVTAMFSSRQVIQRSRRGV